MRPGTGRSMERCREPGSLVAGQLALLLHLLPEGRLIQHLDAVCSFCMKLSGRTRYSNHSRVKQRRLIVDVCASHLLHCLLHAGIDVVYTVDAQNPGPTSSWCISRCNLFCSRRSIAAVPRTNSSRQQVVFAQSPAGQPPAAPPGPRSSCAAGAHPVRIPWLHPSSGSFRLRRHHTRRDVGQG